MKIKKKKMKNNRRIWIFSPRVCTDCEKGAERQTPNARIVQVFHLCKIICVWTVRWRLKNTPPPPPKKSLYCYCLCFYLITSVGWTRGVTKIRPMQPGSWQSAAHYGLIVIICFQGETKIQKSACPSGKLLSPCTSPKLWGGSPKLIYSIKTIKFIYWAKYMLINNVEHRSTNATVLLLDLMNVCCSYNRLCIKILNMNENSKAERS